eukprot:444794_1
MNIRFFKRFVVRNASSTLSTSYLSCLSEAQTYARLASTCPFGGGNGSGMRISDRRARNGPLPLHRWPPSRTGSFCPTRKSAARAGAACVTASAAETAEEKEAGCGIDMFSSDSDSSD